MWLRNISCQILSSYFTAVDNSKTSADTFYLMKPSILFHLAVSLCCQLKVPLSDDAIGKVIMQNLVFSISHLHSFLEKNEHMDVSSFWSSLDSAEQDRFLKAFGILDPRKGKRTLKLYISDASDQHDKYQHPFISYFLQRMGKLTFQMEANQVCLYIQKITLLIAIEIIQHTIDSIFLQNKQFLHFMDLLYFKIHDL